MKRRILDALRVHCVAGFTHLFRQPFDAATELREATLGCCLDRCRHSVEVAVGQAVEQVAVVATVVLHRVGDRHSEGNGIQPEFVGQVNQGQRGIGVVDPEVGRQQGHRLVVDLRAKTPRLTAVVFVVHVLVTTDAAEVAALRLHDVGPFFDGRAIQRDCRHGSGRAVVELGKRLLFVHPLQRSPCPASIIFEIAVPGAPRSEVDLAVDVTESTGSARIGAVGSNRPQVLRGHDAAVSAAPAETLFGIARLELVVGRESDRGVAHRFVVLCRGTDRCEMRFGIPLVERLDTFVDRLPFEVGRREELKLRRSAVVSLSESEQRWSRGTACEDHVIDSQPAKLRAEVAAPCSPHEAGSAAVRHLQRRVSVEEGAQPRHDPRAAEEAEVHDQRCGRGVGIIDINVAQELRRPRHSAQGVFEILGLDRFEAHRFVREIHVVAVDHHRSGQQPVTLLHDASSFRSVRAS